MQSGPEYLHVDLNGIKKYRSCSYIDRFHLNFNGLNGHQDNCNNTGCIEFCCLSLSPGVASCNEGSESIKRIKQKRDAIIIESKLLSLNKDIGTKNNTTTCDKCPFFKERTENGDGLIHFVNINMYPAPCQCKCIYCGVHNSESGIINEKSTECYTNMFNAIQWAESTGMIAADAIWQVASGEIAIHPYKDKILKLVRDKNVRILTNSFIYDEGVAEILNENCLASINLSIDAGTSKTWNKVKGVNNFDNVLKNLEKYSACSIRPEQVTLKYIILPGINDNLEDYQGIIDIMKQLKIKKLIISRDNRFRIEKLIICNSYKSKPEYNNERYSVTDRAAGYLTAMLRQSGMSAENGFFWPDDYQKADSIANELRGLNII